MRWKMRNLGPHNSNLYPNNLGISFRTTLLEWSSCDEMVRVNEISFGVGIKVICKWVGSRAPQHARTRRKWGALLITSSELIDGRVASHLAKARISRRVPRRSLRHECSHLRNLRDSVSGEAVFGLPPRGGWALGRYGTTPGRSACSSPGGREQKPHPPVGGGPKGTASHSRAQVARPA